MKLQGFTVVFALVAIPLILVLTYYIQLQVDTITLQTSYDSKLLNATYSAMSSFEINTANEDLSSVSDSLRTIIEASNNTFFNTLSTNLGMSNASKSYLEPYVPAILYTLYDGYYISTPTLVPEVCENSKEQGVYVGDNGVTYDSSVGAYRYVMPTEENPQENVYVDYSKLNEQHITDYGQLLYLKDGTTDQYTTDVNEAKKTRKNVLKTYMPYSARYTSENVSTHEKEFDITVVYTLDNYITINGTIKEGNSNVYYSKSGYLLPKDCIRNDAKLKFEPSTITSYNQNSAEEYIKSGNDITVTIDNNDDIKIVSGGTIEFQQRTDIDGVSGGKVVLKTYKELEDYLIILNNKLEEVQDTENPDSSLIKDLQSRINIVQYKLNQMSAVIYYTKAYIFSDWVYDNLNNSNKHVVLEDNLVEVSDKEYSVVKGNEELFHKFEGSNIPVFETNGSFSENKGITEIAVDSPFYTHKLNVIRNSIQYNLNLAMSTYNLETVIAYQYEMPVLQNEEWERILSNVSIVSFMQGYSCGLKTYNNYMVVSSTNNELTVDPQNIYYVPRGNFSNEGTEYHRIDCSHIDVVDEYISFTSKEVKYDKIYDKSKEYHKYKYDHKNLACYFCINDGNYENVKFDTLDNKLKKAYYIAVGKERNNIYKMNAVNESLGYEVIFDKLSSNQAHVSNTNSSAKPLSEIKSIEIVLDKINTRTSENLRYDYYIGNNKTDITANTFIEPNNVDKNSIPSSNAQTEIKITIDPASFGNNNNKFNAIMLHVKNQLQETSTVHTKGHPNRDDLQEEPYNGSLEIYNDKIFQNAIKYIRVIYK